MMGGEVEISEVQVVIVEDNADNMMVAQDLVYLAGVRKCEGVEDGAAAMALLERLPRVDLVLLDIQLPGEDGYEVLARIRGHPELGDTKVVAMTAGVLAEDVGRARVAGFDGFVGKPLEFERFPGQVRRILAGEEVWEPG